MILLLLLLPLVSARIDLVVDLADEEIFISIKPGPTEAEVTIDHRDPKDIQLLTDKEKETFHITKENLKEAVETLTNKKPTDVYITAVPGNDFYIINNWYEVKRDFKLKNIKIVNVTTVDETQSENLYANIGTEKKTIQAHVSEAHVSFNSSHRWSGDVKISATVRYELIRPAKEHLNYLYGSVVGDHYFSSGLNIVSFGDTTAKFDLNAGQSAKFIISARIVTCNVEAKYETKLTGDVVARYADTYKGKEFWSYDVNEVLSALNVSAVETRELVTISYIKDYLVQVVDVVTGKDIPYTDLEKPDY